jgi:hypothetical protein
MYCVLCTQLNPWCSDDNGCWRGGDWATAGNALSFRFVSDKSRLDLRRWGLSGTASKLLTLVMGIASLEKSSSKPDTQCRTSALLAGRNHGTDEEQRGEQRRTEAPVTYLWKYTRKRVPLGGALLPGRRRFGSGQTPLPGTCRIWMPTDAREACCVVCNIQLATTLANGTESS